MPGTEYEADFFVSHADADAQWAEWIAAELKGAGYGVIVKAWDFLPGENLLDRLDRALATCRHTIGVLSPDYVASEAAARTAAHYQGLEGKERALIPVKVADHQVPPSMGPIISIDLCDVGEEDEARSRLLNGVAGRVARVARGGFPNAPANRIRFPGAAQEVWELRGHRPDPHFVGRDDALAGLRRAFRAGRATSAVQAITGLGGLGKTQLAVEYASRHAAAYDLVWWIRAEDPATLRGDYAELATALGLPFDQDGQAVAALRQELRRRKDWLLVFDNAEDPGEVFPLLPDRHSGHVLITSRLREWPHAESRHVEVLPLPAAVEYLRRRGQVTDVGTARELAEALGRLPLALTQAAGVIADGMRATDYLGLLRRQSPELFVQGRAGAHDTTVASTWRVSFDRLAGRSPAAVALFRLAAFLGAEEIPLDRLTPVPDMPAELAEALIDPFRRRDATRALGEYSLAETGDGLLSIHRMVQTVTRTELAGDEPFWAGLALAVITAAFPHDVRDPRSWPACEAVLAHAITGAEHAGRLHVDTGGTVDLLNQVALYLLERGRTDRAATAVENALPLAARLPRDAPERLRCRNTHGLLLLAQGDHAAARQAHEEVYEARIRILGPDDVDTLRAGRDLVEALYLLGQWAQATRLQDRLVQAFTAVLGADDLETVTSVAYQATLLRSAGQYQRARTLEEGVLEVRRRLLGEEHPDTLDAMGTLGTTLHAQGKWGKARALEEGALEVRRRLLGEEHPSTLIAMNNLAVTLRSQGELEGARALAEGVLEACRRLLGEEHPRTFDAMANLGSTLHAQGELEGARALAEGVLEGRRRLLGEEHPRTFDAMASLGSTLYAQGELEGARALEERVLEARRRLLGEEHPHTLTAMANLGSTLHTQGDLEGARALEERVLEACRRLLGEEHPNTLDAMANLGSTLHTQGELDGARALAEGVLVGRRWLLGEEHPRTLDAMTNLAVTRHAQGETAEARSLFLEALTVSLRAFGKKNTVTSEIAWRMVSTYDRPHEAARRKNLILENLSWLEKESPNRLTGQQKSIKDRVKGLFGGRSAKRQGKRGK
ncbi:FxSxx-COOH system tetratricopeptide repeat protein [Streptosporangium canum]|uniref:FxSxx-COOH system tetratricopeptide repeat protein n=1 Tax=Streptosporangium canum TaxID=324952 RepID=UPI0034472B77